ncbi:hypothetical protein ATANTOWER_008036 [Ataeniobius toweri]|uniref:Uncharacterized protein n=1 Tax=Ataeniobius toweri TaxID=208326 RepID=A0ABU7C786_9TELE|nr:hypothetical protein [Ataeniobius toweri]
MAPLLLLAVWLLGVGAFLDAEDTSTRERLFLSSLGLSERPRPAGSQQPRRPIPSEIWRMFRRSANIQARESESCTVSEYGVRGNIIRYVQDQGGELLVRRSRPCRWLSSSFSD